MRTLKISLLIFILSITIPAQSRHLYHNDKILQNPFLTHTTDSIYLDFQQEIISTINKVKVKQNDKEYFLIDSLVSKSTDGSQYKFIFKYNPYGKMVERTGLISFNGELEIFEKVEYFYNTYNNLIKELYFDWNNAAWDSLLQILYEYNQNNNLISTTLQSYISGNWENESRSTNTYDQAGNEITSLSELWQNNQWTNSSMVYNYYSPQYIRDSLQLQKWDGNNWQNYLRITFYYDSLTTFLELSIAQIWTGNQFQDYLKVNINNDELGNQVQQLEQIWNGSTWVNDIKKDYRYIWNYFESGYSELWNGTNWVPGDSPILINNPDGFKIAINSQSIHIYYKIVNVGSTNSNTPNDFSLSQNYPNPFNPSTKISWQSPIGSWQTLKVYDILGNEVATLVNEYRNAGNYEIDFQSTVSSHQLANGVYFYRLQAGDYVETRKMILLK